MWPVVEVIAERDVAKDCRGSMAVLQRINANEGHRQHHPNIMSKYQTLGSPMASNMSWRWYCTISSSRPSIQSLYTEAQVLRQTAGTHEARGQTLDFRLHVGCLENGEGRWK